MVFAQTAGMKLKAACMADILENAEADLDTADAQPHRHAVG